jgi:hypothetical protein
LLEVAEFSCLKLIPLALVMSLNCTSGVGVAPIRQQIIAKAMIKRHACMHLLMVG